MKKWVFHIQNLHCLDKFFLKIFSNDGFHVFHLPGCFCGWTINLPPFRRPSSLLNGEEEENI